MARKPNYDFERREREKAKAAKTAERVSARTKTDPQREPEPGQTTPPKNET